MPSFPPSPPPLQLAIDGDEHEEEAVEAAEEVALEQNVDATQGDGDYESASEASVAPRRVLRGRNLHVDYDEGPEGSPMDVDDGLRSSRAKGKRPSSRLDDEYHSEGDEHRENDRPASMNRIMKRSRSPIPVLEDEEADELDIISLSSHSSSPSPVTPSLPVDSVERDAQAPPAPEAEVDEAEGRASQDADDEEEFVAHEAPHTSAMSVDEIKDESPSPTPSPSAPKTPPQTSKSALPLDLSSPMAPPKPPPPPIIVHLSSSLPSSQPMYAFDDSLPPSVPVRPPSPVNARYRKATQYTLPPASTLPVEFNRKGKPAKLRKKEKERDKSGSDSGKKEDWTPLGMARWAAMLRANPVYRKVNRATKCVSTKDWNVSSCRQASQSLFAYVSTHRRR